MLEVPMTTLPKISLAALSGLAVLVLAGQADAAVDRRKFQASPGEIRRYCERIDQDFWRAKRSYGCGEKIRCTNGNCRVWSPPPPPPPPNYPPRLFSLDGDEHGEGGKTGGGTGGGRGGGSGSGSGGKGGSSAAGGAGPN
jgi:uncharacterized membrane protein YgcG